MLPRACPPWIFGSASHGRARPPATDENVPVIRPTSPLSWCREPADKSDVGASGTPNCCQEHETQIPLVEAPPDGNDPIAEVEEASRWRRWSNAARVWTCTRTR